MAAGEASLASELLSLKKALPKTPPSELGKSDTLSDSIRLVTQKTLPGHHPDQLALLLVLLKQLRQAVSLGPSADRSALLDVIQDTLGPAFLPGGSIADLLLLNFEHSMKAHQFRALECTHAVARLASALSESGSGVISLEPLFLVGYRSGMINKPSLLIVSNLLEAVSESAVPEDLLPAMLDGLKLPDNGTLRAGIIVGILEKRRSGPTPLSDQDIVHLVLPLLGSSTSTNIKNNMNRYLLPSLFKAFPGTLPALLAALAAADDDETFTSWVSVASLGVSLGLLELDQVPAKDLRDALSHEDAAVRLKAFDVVTGCKDSCKLLTEGVITLVKEALLVNAILPGSGARSDFASAAFVFFTNLRQAGTFARRKLRKPNADTSATSPEAISLEILRKFHLWFIQDLIDPALVSARRIPVYRPLFALQMLEQYVGVFGEDETVRDVVYTDRMVKLLIGCQASEFTEVRGRARKILKSAPSPLPGYPSLDSPNARALLHSAYSSFSNPRRTQNDAAVAGLCILFEKVLIPSDTADGKASIAFVGGVIDQLEAELVRGEEGIKHGMDDLALHGLIAAARALIGCVDLHDPSAQQAWRPSMHRLSGLISRIWQLTRTIMSLSSSAPGEGAPNSDAGPAHEIAKAYQMLSNGQDEEDDGEVDTRKILSACWRATKEASDLLSLIIAQPISQGGDTQAVWAKEEVHQAGRQYLQWMHEIRHRGTFSKVALAFASVIDAVKTSESLRDLADQWLELELEAITDDTLSTTRRSAALPYSLLSIVAGDEILLNKAIDRLIDLARLDNSSTSDITRVHCFNILKIVLLDARQTRLFNNYFERTVMTAVAAFSSANWNVRNVGLILFSTLVHRSLTPSRGSPDFHASRMTLAGRQTFAAWHAKHPKLLPYIVRYLSGEMPGLPSAGEHSPLFPMLIIIRSLRWSEKGGEVQEGLKGVVRPHLGSPERQVREVAAQALSSLLSPAEALHEATQWPWLDPRDFNAIHGQLVYVRNLISSVVEWTTASAEEVSAVESLLRFRYDLYTKLPCPPILTELLHCISRYIINTTPSPDFIDWAGTSAISIISAPRSPLPGADALLVAAADLALSHQPSEAATLAILASSSESCRLVGLERLSTPSSSRTAAVFERVAEVVISERISNAIRPAALEALSHSEGESWPATVLEGIPSSRRLDLRDAVVGLLSARCIPLREAALPAAAWAVMWCREQSGGGDADNGLERLARVILNASQETQSQPRREVAITSLIHLQPILFPSTPSTEISSNILLLLHQALLRLLQDDDEDVRLIAADLVRNGLGFSRAITHSRAVEAWWAWLGGYLDMVEVRAPWVRWWGELAVNRADLDEDLAILQPAKTDHRAFTSADLFAEEKPNLFRDPLNDAQHASHLLERLRQSGGDRSSGSADASSVADGAGLVEEVRRFEKAGAERAGEISPIDDAWRVMGILPAYLEVLERAFPPSTSQ